MNQLAVTEPCICLHFLDTPTKYVGGDRAGLESYLVERKRRKEEREAEKEDRVKEDKRKKDKKEKDRKMKPDKNAEKKVQ